MHICRVFKYMSAIQTEFAPGPSPTASAALSVHMCRKWDELEQFRERWNSLLRANPRFNLSNSRMAGCMVAGLWPGQRPFCACVFGLNWRHRRDSSLVCRPHTFSGLALNNPADGGSGVRRLRRPGLHHRTRICKRVCTGIYLVAFRTKRMADLRSGDPAAEFAGSGCIFHGIQESGMRIDSTLTPNFMINLPPTWAEYVSSLDSSFRPLLTRYPRRLQSRFTVKFSRCEDLDELKAQLQTLFDLHQMRWTGRGEIGAFAGNERRDFYQRMATAFLQRGWLEFWRLELNGEIVGAQFCFRYNDTVSLLQEGFHPKYAAEKIGYALKAHLLEEMIRTGAKRYDFLGGADPYKSKFGAHQENYLNIFIAGPSKLGRLYLQVEKKKRGIKAWLKRKLPAALVARLRGHAKSGAVEPMQQNSQSE